MPHDPLKPLRNDWQTTANEHLGDVQKATRIDARSLEAQGDEALAKAKAALDVGNEAEAEVHLARAEELTRRPQTHLGPAVFNMERRAIAKAEKLGLPYEPVTDRLRQALADGTAPLVFVDAYERLRAKK